MGEVDLHQQVAVEWTLGGKFLRMYFESDAPEGNPTSEYEAVYHIGFDEEEGIYVLHLLDTTEVPLECVVGLGKRRGNRIPFLFPYGDTKFFNIFIWEPEQKRWRFLQTFEEEGEMKTFAEKTMTRIAG
jgi:hypothetical protein